MTFGPESQVALLSVYVRAENSRRKKHSTDKAVLISPHSTQVRLSVTLTLLHSGLLASLLCHKRESPLVGSAKLSLAWFV